MKVSKSWLKELVEIEDINEVIRLLPLRTIALKSVTEDYIELDMKGYNRADLLSIRGVAREVAAITDSKVKYKENQKLTFVDKDIPEVSVGVKDNKLCPFYSLTKLETLKVEQSDDTWVQKLSDSGFRSINNIADLTNLVMIEFGQPFHAFDGDKVKGAVSVRKAKKAEKLLTLDGKLRELDSEDLVIADENGPIGLAGVMGGKETEVSDSTKTILLEAAIFDPVTIRKTAQRLHLPSEASKRFQHGLTKTGLHQALDEAIRLYKNLGGKLTAITIIGHKNDQVKKINLTQEKINSLIGVDIPEDQVERSLTSLGFKLELHPKGVIGNSWEVTVPYWRLDIDIEVDLVEEIARMYGYEKIPSKELQGELPESIDQSLPDFIYNLKKQLFEIGLTEVQTYSFYSTPVLRAFCLNEENAKNAVKIANPISSETEYMRTFIWPNLIEAIGKNLRQGFKDIAIFEVGKIYQPGPKESYKLAIAIMNGTDNPIEELSFVIAKAEGAASSVAKQSQNRIATSPSAPQSDIEKSLFHPTRFATLELNGKHIGDLAEVHPRFLNQFGIDKRVAILEIALNP